MEWFREMLVTLVVDGYEMERQLLIVERVLHKMEWKSWLQKVHYIL